jgi:hypothetical protein
MTRVLSRFSSAGANRHVLLAVPVGTWAWWSLLGVMLFVSSLCLVTFALALWLILPHVGQQASVAMVLMSGVLYVLGQLLLLLPGKDHMLNQQARRNGLALNYPLADAEAYASGSFRHFTDRLHRS